MDLNLDLNKLKNIKLTKDQQQYVVFAVLLVGGAVWGYWTKLMVPLGKAIVEKQETLEDEKRKLNEARKFDQKEYDLRVEKVQEGMRYFSRRLPPADEGYSELKKVIRLVIESGVDLKSIKPERGKSSKDFSGFKQNPTTVVIDADYHDLGAFLSKLTGEELLYVVEELQLAQAPVDAARPLAPRVSATLKLVTYAEEKRKK